MAIAPGAYPLTYDVDAQVTDRNRMTVAFRIILAIPHLLLVGAPGGVSIGLPAGVFFNKGQSQFGSIGGNGILGAVAGVMAIISWFSIVFTGNEIKGLYDFRSYYLRWRARAVAYTALLRDDYPPFGEGAYPVQFALGEMPTVRDRWSVGLRLIYALPHAIVLLFVGIAWVITAIIAWFAILFTGAYPDGMYKFGIGYLRWSLRVEGYVLLMYDTYPPFSLD
ncbi:MAG TPA: DUF4389 domain-containing protein [Dehalococcoidia bacterium]|nr:DUF4389 domain-containing protein [Dehalococcoidia bacterium]